MPAHNIFQTTPTEHDSEFARENSLGYNGAESAMGYQEQAFAQYQG